MDADRKQSMDVPDDREAAERKDRPQNAEAGFGRSAPVIPCVIAAACICAAALVCLFVSGARHSEPPTQEDIAAEAVMEPETAGETDPVNEPETESTESGTEPETGTDHFSGIEDPYEAVRIVLDEYIPERRDKLLHDIMDVSGIDDDGLAGRLAELFIVDLYCLDYEIYVPEPAGDLVWSAVTFTYPDRNDLLLEIMMGLTDDLALSDQEADRYDKISIFVLTAEEYLMFGCDGMTVSGTVLIPCTFDEADGWITDMTEDVIADIDTVLYCNSMEALMFDPGEYLASSVVFDDPDKGSFWDGLENAESYNVDLYSYDDHSVDDVYDDPFVPDTDGCMDDPDRGRVIVAPSY